MNKALILLDQIDVEIAVKKAEREILLRHPVGKVRQIRRIKKEAELLTQMADSIRALFVFCQVPVNNFEIWFDIGW